MLSNAVRAATRSGARTRTGIARGHNVRRRLGCPTQVPLPGAHVRGFGTAALAKAAAAPKIARATGQDNEDGSVYENYHEASQVYDTIRHPGGAEVILGAWAAGSGLPLHKQAVLDIGCGTGNYAAAVAPHVGSLTCMDGNASMLAKCEAKLRGLGGDASTLRFVQNLLPSLECLESNTFDSAMCNLVIHHIEDDTTRPTWANFTALVAEAKRVLKPGGTLSFNHITPEQVDTYWYLDYVPECKERFRSTLVPTDKMTSIMEDAGFSGVNRTAPIDYVLFRPTETYLDPRGPLDTSWRKSASMWAVGEEDELAVALRRIADDNESGAISDVISESEQRRAALGHTCFFYGTA